MGWLTSLFGSSKSVDKVVETAAKGIYNGIDMLVYTDEEKAIQRTKGVELFMRFTEKALDQNSIRSVTRRWLAFMIVFPTVMLFVGSAIAFPLEVYFGDPIFIEDSTVYLTPISDHWFKLFETFAPWASGILATYFGPHLIGAFRNGDK